MHICNYLGQTYSNIWIIHIKFHTKTHFCSDEMKLNTMCYLCAKRCLQWLCPYMLMIINHIFSLATIAKQILNNNKEAKNEKVAFDLDKCQIAFGYFFKIIFFHLYFLQMIISYCKYGHKLIHPFKSSFSLNNEFMYLKRSYFYYTNPLQ